MAERLNSMAYNENPASNYSSPGFNPCSVSLDIRTPEELAAVNEFLLALGRDVSGLPNRPLSSSHSPTFPTENYFDPSNLSQLGLAGMPGIPSSFADASYNGHYSHRGSYHTVRSNHATLPNQYGAMYDLHDPLSGYSQAMDCGRRQSKYTGVSAFSNQHHRPTPPLDGGSPHSTVSTPPVTTTPPQMSMSMPDTFDILRPSRTVPVAHLAAPDYMTKTMRPMIPLKSALPDCRPPPVEPILPVGQHRPRSSLPTSSSNGNGASSKAGSGLLYPLLTSGDAQYKLPPLGKMYRSPSQQSSRNASPYSSTRSSPNMQPTVLPSIYSIADYDDEHHLSRQVGSIELERRRSSSRVLPVDRKRHAEFILNLMVTINRNFKNQPQSATDVEMDSP